MGANRIMKRTRSRPKQKDNGDGDGDRNIPNLEEATRVASYIVTIEMKKIADTYSAQGTPNNPDALRQLLALTIAVAVTVEHFYQLVGVKFPDHWESFERSAQALNDHGLLKLWDVELEGKRAVKRQRRRRLVRRAGALQLVESHHNANARWAAVTLSDDAPVPLTAEVREGLPQAAEAFERLIQNHLDASSLPQSPLVLCGQIVGLLCAAEFLLSAFPRDIDHVAAFCVRIAAMQVAHEMKQEGAL